MVTFRGRTERRLLVAMNGRLVGRWQAGSGEHRFRYAPEWLASPDARHLSLSMPLTFRDDEYRGPLVEAWFDQPVFDGVADAIDVLGRG